MSVRVETQRQETRTERLVAANVRDRIAELSPTRPIEILPPDATVTLRALRESDRGLFCEAVASSREQLQRWIGLFRRVGLAPEARHESLDELFDRQLALTEIGERTRSACRRVGVLGDGRIIGCFNLGAISRGLEFQAEASWWVATPWAGKGLATQGVRRLLDYAFADQPDGLGLHKVLANIQTDNAACLRVATKLGFRPIPGVLSSVPVDGVPLQHQLYTRSIIDE